MILKFVIISVIVFFCLMALEIGVQLFVNYGRQKPSKGENFFIKKYRIIKNFIIKRYRAFKGRKTPKAEQ